MARILMLEDQADLVRAWSLALEAAGHEVLSAGDHAVFERICGTQSIDLIIVDLSL